MMKAKCFLLLLLSFPVLGERLPATEAPSTTASNDYSEVTCTCSDILTTDDVLKLAADTRDRLGPLLGLSRHWRFPVHIRIALPDDPPADQIQDAGVAAIASGKTMRLEAVLPATDPTAKEFIQRQYVTALLWEKFFQSTDTFDTNTKLDVVPLWLTEGLREWLNDDPEHDRESIVRKATQAKRAPSLTEVTHWTELSHGKLLGLWQRAFCYYLVESLVQPGARRDNFQQWLSTFSGANPTPPQFLFPTEAGWQRELVEATHRSRDLVYSWDQTAAELSSAETLAIPGKKSADTRICTLSSIAAFSPGKMRDEAVRQKIFDLTALELRAHASWQPILELYRAGLTALITEKNPDEARKLLTEANEKRIAEMAFHQQLVDYVNWFEVTKDYAGNTTHFRDYFWTAHQMERVEGDPLHPNPIRADLLQVESQL